MAGLIANLNCKLVYEPTSVLPGAMVGTPSGSWTPAGNAKVSAGNVAILDESCQLIVPSMQINDPSTFTASQVGNTIAPTTFKFTATATKVTAGNQKVLCINDKAQAQATFAGTKIAGPSTVPIQQPYNVTIMIVDPGQTKVTAR